MTTFPAMRRWIPVVCVALAGCFGGKAGEFDRAKAEAQDKNKDAGAAAQPSEPAFGGGNPFGAMGSLFASSLDKPGPFEEPKKSKDFDEDKDHLAVLDLSGAVVELQSMNWWGGQTGTELRVIAERLRELAKNKYARGAFIRMGQLQLDMATAEALRQLLLEYRGNDNERHLYCYAESATTLTFYVMTACEELVMPTNGSLFFAGVAASPVHLRGLLDRFGVQPDFVTVGSYKGAAEALTRKAPSPQMNETIDGILDTAYRTLVTDVSSARGMAEAEVRRLIDLGLFTSHSALKAKLIDRLDSFYRYRDATAGSLGWTKLSWKEKDQPGFGQLMQFLMGSSRPSGKRLAVIYAVGNIIDGSGEGVIGARGEIASGTLVPAIRALGADDDVKAIVLRINSPGGSALASELIAEALAEAASNKPIVVSMGGVAASGGYYIAAGAKKIFAERNTLTGSIGVVGGKIVLGGALARYGIQAYPRSRGKSAFMFSPMQAWNATERKAVVDTMRRVYDVFIDRVAKGRSLTREQVLAVAEGRVWTGEVALGNGLVDQLGGLDAAIKEARKLAKLDDDSAIETYPPTPGLRDFLVAFGQVQAPFGINLLDEALQEIGGAEASIARNLLAQLELLKSNRILAVTFLSFVVH